MDICNVFLRHCSRIVDFYTIQWTYSFKTDLYSNQFRMCNSELFNKLSKVASRSEQSLNQVWNFNFIFHSKLNLNIKSTNLMATVVRLPYIVHSDQIRTIRTSHLVVLMNQCYEIDFRMKGQNYFIQIRFDCFVSLILLWSRVSKWITFRIIIYELKSS